MLPEFISFNKIPRYSKDMIITEKIDGTNGQIYITEEGELFAGSRTRWLTVAPESKNDNHGFAKWVYENYYELFKLGPGRHFGEWWGQGIQRNYGLKKKCFSLFNTKRWGINPDRPECCGVVPVLFEGEFSTKNIEITLKLLAENGSSAAPGFMKPEGIVIYHIAGKYMFKKTIEKDEIPKSEEKNWNGYKKHALITPRIEDYNIDLFRGEI